MELWLGLLSGKAGYYGEVAGTYRQKTDEEYREQLLSMKFDVYDFYTAIKSKYVREYQYEYYVLRRSIAAFETGEIEEIND